MGESVQSKETFSCPKQVYNFVDEMKCRSEGHMGVPKILLSDGTGKVVVDIGLDAGLEFFAAINSSYSVFGFEANPRTVQSLRVKCEVLGKAKCEYIDPETAKFPLAPKHKGGYLIGAALGSEDGYLNLTLAGPGSSLVEAAPGVVPTSTNTMTVRVLKLSDIVNTDVFFYKLDVQGAEFEVLKGSEALFVNNNVKTMMMEVYPRGLGHAGVNMNEFMTYLYDNLGMFCSTAHGVFGDHPNSLKDFAAMLQAHTGSVWWGKFDDVVCFNSRKTWHRNLMDMEQLMYEL